MVQWLKRKWAAFRSYRAIQRAYEFNLGKLSTEMQNLSDALYGLQEEMSFKIVMELLAMGQNIQALSMSHVRTQEELLVARGRIQALSDLRQYLAIATDPKIQAAKIAKDKEQKTGTPRGVINTAPRRTGNQAGAAI